VTGRPYLRDPRFYGRLALVVAVTAGVIYGASAALSGHAKPHQAARAPSCGNPTDPVGRGIVQVYLDVPGDPAVAGRLPCPDLLALAHAVKAGPGGPALWARVRKIGWHTVIQGDEPHWSRDPRVLKVRYVERKVSGEPWAVFVRPGVGVAFV